MMKHPLFPAIIFELCKTICYPNDVSDRQKIKIRRKKIKKLFSILVAIVMSAVMLTTVASAYTVNTVTLGNGVCAVVVKGQETPQTVDDGWMNSSGHRANILNSSYNTIGVGYVADGNYWTQMFVGR